VTSRAETDSSFPEIEQNSSIQCPLSPRSIASERPMNPATPFSDLVLQAVSGTGFEPHITASPKIGTGLKASRHSHAQQAK
jgi:hypothetical protein